MRSPEPAEHFVTLFDSKFMLSGIALHESLQANCPGARLWVIAADDLAVEQLSRLALAGVRVVPLPEIETEDLLRVKLDRTRGEYCWTVTPFLAEAVFGRDPTVQRVTYVDADLFFFDRPSLLLEELDASGKSVMITDHGYAPEYDRSARSGRFCVQFLTFRRNTHGQAVAKWWQEKCLEWCYARYEAGRFGDQKYLDQWPELFGDQVHVVRQVERTLAPWNVDWYSRVQRAAPIFFHFQGFRILRPDRVKLFHGYSIATRNRWIYDTYVGAVAGAARRLAALGYGVPTMPEHAQRLKTVKYFLMQRMGLMEFVDLSQQMSAERVSVAAAATGNER